jgi:O-antigen/teichoic acid export membrane protein
VRRHALHARARESQVSAERSAAAGGVILVARFAAAAVLNYIFGIALAWLLVPAEFGTVSAAQNVLLLAAGLLTAGLPWALAMRVAETHGDQEAAKPEFRTALVTNAGFGLLLGAAFLAAQLSGLQLVPTHSLVLDLAVAVEMPVLAVNAALGGAAQGSRRFGGLGAMQSGEILVKCVSAVFLVTVLHAGPAGVALGFLIGTLGSVLIGVRTDKGLLPGRGPLASLSFLAASGSIWFAFASMTFLITADLLGLEVVGEAAGVTAAVLAGYQACGLLARASYYVSGALAEAVFPFMARSETLQEKHRWFVAAARWVPLLIIPVQVGLFLAPGPVLRLFLPDHYSGAQTLLRVLAAGTLGAVITDMLMKSLFALGYGRQIGRLMPITVVVEVIGLVTLVRGHGALGAAYSYLIASYAGVALLVPLYLKALQIRLPAPRQLAAYAAGLAPTAVMFALAGRSPAPLAWALIVAGTGLFLLPARRMQLITDADLSVLQTLRGRLKPRAARVAVAPAPAAGLASAPAPAAAARRRRPLVTATTSQTGWPAPALTPTRAPTRARALRASLSGEWRLAAFCACVAGVALLYNVVASPDVLYDEAVYTSAAQKVALGWHLPLDNQPLFVHPPLMFLLQAGWLRLTGHASAALPSAIHTARLLSASVGVADVLLVAALAYRLASSASPRRRRVVTGVVAVLTALDPVLIRYDRQDVIEPFALCISLLVLHAAWALRDRGAFAYVSITGLLSGLALLTNQITIFLVVVPPIFALLERNCPLIRRSFAAFGIALAFFLTFPLWAVELGLGSSFVYIQTNTLQRLIGLVQNTGFNVPGVSFVGALIQSVTHYSSSYIVLAIGFVALVWCWTRRNTQSGSFLTAWLTASYAFGAYIVAVGTLNVNFFVYPLPASIVGSVLLADALIVGWVRRATRTRVRRPSYPGRASRVPLTIGAVGCAGLVGLSAASWVTNYSGTSDGVAQVDQFIASTLPACTAVNASGDPQKYSLLLRGRNFAYFSVGAAALADGVHDFILSPNDAIEREGNMSPALASWIRDHGRRLAIFPSQVYNTVQLWYVSASPYDPVADLVDIPGGAYVNTVGSHCGGYTVTNGSLGSFYSGYQALGGKSMAGDPLSRVTGSGQGGHEQLFDGVVLAVQPATGPGVRALPVVAMLAKDSPAAYRRAALPPVLSSGTVAQRRDWLTNPALRRVYLGGEVNSPVGYAAAVRRYGEPLGPPATLPGGRVGQPFADIVLEMSSRGGSVHAAAVTPAALAAGLLSVPTRARDSQPPPPLPPDQYSSIGSIGGLPPAEPTSVEPFVANLGAALLLYGSAVATLGRRQRRRRRASAGEPRRVEAAS